jgi:Mce-associated membrane protein
MTEPESRGNETRRGATESTVISDRRVDWWRVLVYGLLPSLALLLATAAALLKWHDSSDRNIDLARVESVQAAKDSTTALLSFTPDTIDKDVQVARDRLTGGFRETYIQVTREVLIPNAKEKHVAASATVPAAASVSATENHAVVLVFVDQTVTIGSSPPNNAASSVRVTLDKIGERWMISGFDSL